MRYSLSLHFTPKMEYTSKLLPFYNISKVVSPHTSCMTWSSSNHPQLFWSYHWMSLTFYSMSPHQPAHTRHAIVACHVGSLSANTLSHWSRGRQAKDPKSSTPPNNVILAKDCNFIIVSNAPKLHFFMTFRSFITPLVTTSCYYLNILYKLHAIPCVWFNLRWNSFFWGGGVPWREW